MKIIDFKKKGNVVRFYLGEETPDWGWTRSDYTRNGTTPDWLKPSDRYYGDDWDDRPYEHNAGQVYEEFIKGYKDVAFDFDDLVLENLQTELEIVILVGVKMIWLLEKFHVLLQFQKKFIKIPGMMLLILGQVLTVSKSIISVMMNQF